MKRTSLFLLFSLFFVSGFAQCIEKKTTIGGYEVSITSSEHLFSGCEMRMARCKKGSDVFYGIELDLTDRATHVCKGNLFTIHFDDGSRISLANLYDTKAEVSEETHVESFDHIGTDFVPVYDAWYGAVYSVPVDVHYTEHTPVTTSTSFASLYYIISKHEIEDIISKKISNVSIVTDQETIVKKARPLSRSVAKLFPIIK